MASSSLTSDSIAEAEAATRPAAERTPQRRSDYAIEARDLYKTYRAVGKQPAKRALNGINLAVPHGSIFGLLGPNGAGKSTFINILAGLVVKTSGHISVWGFDIDVNPRQTRASIGVVPQELSIDPFFTPAEVLEFQAGMYGVPPGRRRTREVLATVSLEEHADAYARTLSGGMRRRLLVAKAMVHDPPVIILDEPTAGVDVELRRQLWDYIRTLHQRGSTVVLTTHYLEEAQSLCEQIAIIDQGNVVACEPTPQLLQRIDRKSLIISPESPLAKLPETLKGLAASLTPDGKLVIEYQARRIRVSDILSRISEAGVVIDDITTRETDLEDVFLKLTQHEADGEEVQSDT